MSSPSNRIALRAKAYDRIKRRLLSGDYRPGQMVSLRHLSKACGVAIALTREVLQRLEFEALVRIYPHRGVQLVEMNVEFVREAFQLRLILEKEGARKLAEIAPDRVFDEMELIVRTDMDALKEGVSDDLLRRVAANNLRFHEPLIDVHNSATITEIYRSNLERIGFINRNVNLPLGGAFLPSMLEHLAIVEALRSRKPDAAAKAVDDHINAALRRVMSL